MLNIRSHFTEDEWNETPGQRQERFANERRLKSEKSEFAKVPKGVCPKCNKKIGRGVAFHVKACKA